MSSSLTKKHKLPKEKRIFSDRLFLFYFHPCFSQLLEIVVLDTYCDSRTSNFHSLDINKFNVLMLHLSNNSLCSNHAFFFWFKRIELRLVLGKFLFQTEFTDLAEHF